MNIEERVDMLEANHDSHKFASRGQGNAGVALGSVGTALGALGVLGANGGLGNILGGGCRTSDDHCATRYDKALYWEGNGFVLLYKRLESGSFQWPRKESEARALTPQQYRWLMEGLSVDQPKAHKPVSGLEIV